MLVNFGSIRTFIFDINGTVMSWNTLNPHMEKLITTLKKRHKKVYYVTDNCVLTRSMMAEKLTKLGLKTKEDEIISSGYVAATYFESKGIDRVYLCGERGLISEFGNHGITVSEDAEHIIISIDRNFNYMKLKKIGDLVKKGAKLYATGMNRNWYVDDDVYPAEMSIVEAVKSFTGAEVTLLGMPSQEMKSRLLTDVFLFPEDTLLIGDNLKTDIKFGNMCGFRTGLVLTGESTEADLSGIAAEDKPSIVIRDARNITKNL
ncbi:MAG: HAD-IIA family hydrolase [DPANN group archaeon]|nr:HAD-IIA family hydrolase [DPANN group archaeon]